MGFHNKDDRKYQFLPYQKSVLCKQNMQIYTLYR